MNSNDTVFRWLHLADLHFVLGGVDEYISRNALKKEINIALSQNNANNVNCLILSGDVFHQSKLNKESEGELTAFIKSLPGAEQRIVICSGNHDLDREARIQKDSHFDYIYRSDTVPKIYKNLMVDGHTQPVISAGDIDVLYKESFRGFFDYFLNTFNNSLTSSVTKRIPYSSDGNDYELCIDEFNDIAPFPIRVISINTALFAGCPIKGEKLREELEGLKRQITTSEQQHKFKDAAIAYSKYAKYLDEALTYDYVVDDKELYILTKNAERRLTHYIHEDSTAVTILVGHHGMDMLSDSAKSRLYPIIGQLNHPGIYLCGHAHIPAYKRHLLGSHKDIHEFTAGGAFFDKSGYAKYSFDIGEIRVVASRQAEIVVNTYFSIFKPSEECGWAVESETIQINTNFTSTPQLSMLSSEIKEETDDKVEVLTESMQVDFENPKVDSNRIIKNESRVVIERINEPRLVGPRKVELDF